MDGLSHYAASSTEVLPEFLQVEAFAKLSSATGKVIESQVEMPIVGAIVLYTSLLTFCLRVHPDRLDYVDQILPYDQYFVALNQVGWPSVEKRREKIHVCSCSLFLCSIRFRFPSSSVALPVCTASHVFPFCASHVFESSSPPLPSFKSIAR